jgi:type IV secretory pathway component VirB8
LAVLGDGTQKLYITDGKNEQKVFQQQYLTDDDIVTTSAKLVYFRWLSRLVILCAVLSLSFFLASSLVIFRLAPEILVEPLLIIGQNSSEEVVRYEPMNTKMSSLKQMTEMFVKQYVIMRNTVINDEREMRTRWGPGGIVNYMSAPDVYYDFVGANIGSVNRMFDNNFSSEVKIERLYKDTEDSPAWFIEFTVFSLSKRRESSGALSLKINRYKASLTPKFIPERALIRPRLLNPLGFTVIKYKQDEIRG